LTIGRVFAGIFKLMSAMKTVGNVAGVLEEMLQGRVDLLGDRTTAAAN
jgi:hypothetical protein